MKSQKAKVKRQKWKKNGISRNGRWNMVRGSSSLLKPSRRRWSAGELDTSPIETGKGGPTLVLKYCAL